MISAAIERNYPKLLLKAGWWHMSLFQQSARLKQIWTLRLTIRKDAGTVRNESASCSLPSTGSAGSTIHFHGPPGRIITGVLPWGMHWRKFSNISTR